MYKILRLSLSITLLHTVHVSFAQRTVAARVVDQDTKSPIAGAKIEIKEKNINTITNRVGYFQITMDSVDLLTISAPEYETLTFSPPKTGNFQIAIKRATVEFYKEGTDAFYKLFMKNVKYPAAARGANKAGYVYVSFKIDSLGNLKDLELDYDIGGGCGKEVIRVFEKLSTGYLPDDTNSTYILPVLFRIGQDSKESPKIDNVKRGKLLPEVVVTAMRL